MVIETKEMKLPPGATKVTSKPGPTRQFAADAIELAELQLELLRADVRGAAKATAASVAMAIVASCLFLAAAPVMLLALADWLAVTFEFTSASSLALVGIGTAVVAAVMLTIAYYTSKRGVSLLGRSQQEFQRNLAWLKSSLASNTASSTPPH